MAAVTRSKDRPALTIGAIKKAKPQERAYDLFDAGAGKGLALRVLPSGVRVFRWKVNALGRTITIGPWSEQPAAGHVTLAQAHVHLAALKAARRAGTDQLDAAVEKMQRDTRPPPPPPSPAAGSGAVTVRQEAARFVEYLGRRRRRPEQAQRALDHDVLPVIGDRPIASVTRQDVRALVDRVVGRGSPVMARHLLALLNQFFTYAVDRETIPANPANFRDPAALGATPAEMSQRVLSDDEVARFWHGLDAAKKMTPTVRYALRLLLVLGVRTGELLQATWDEIDFDAATWTIPPAHQKMTKLREQRARAWTVPLPPLAVQLLRDLEALARVAGSPYVLASVHGGGEALTEKALSHAMRRLFTGKEPVLRFDGERPSPHDLRRTMRTGLSGLGVAFHVAERALNHSLGKVPETYDVHDLLVDRRKALAAWGAKLESLISPATAKVAFLPQRRRAKGRAPAAR